MTDPNSKDLEQRGLDKVNESESWVKSHWPWLLAVGVALVFGFILGKAV